MKTLIRAALVLLAVAGLAACGDENDTVSSNAEEPSSPASGSCLEGSTDCDDTPTTEPGSDDQSVDEHAAIEEARALVGTAEDELDSSVRISRRGDETFMLTEDYVIGRMTVELDPDDTGTLRVTKVVVELTDGPVTFPE